jgi:hypothetical protein
VEFVLRLCPRLLHLGSVPVVVFVALVGSVRRSGRLVVVIPYAGFAVQDDLLASGLPTARSRRAVARAMSRGLLLLRRPLARSHRLRRSVASAVDVFVALGNGGEAGVGRVGVSSIEDPAD